MIPSVRAVLDGIVYVTVPHIDLAMGSYQTVRVYSAGSEDGEYSQVASLQLRQHVSGYTAFDADGTSSTWYKAALYGDAVGAYSDARQYGTRCAYINAWDVRMELASGDSDTTAVGPEHEHILWDMAVEASRLCDQAKRVEAGAYEAAGSESRYYDSDGGDDLRIDPAVSVTGVAVEETDGTYTDWTVGTDVFTWPRNASAKSEPILRLHVSDKGTSTKSAFTAGQERVKVTGVFGITSTSPYTIQRACKIMTARWFKRAQAAWQDSTMAATAGQLVYTKEMDPEAAKVLATAFPVRPL